MIRRNIATVIGSLLIAFTFIGASVAFGSVSFLVPTQTSQTYENFTFFTATTTSATSTNLTGGGGYFSIAGAKKIEFYFSRGDVSGQGNTGKSIFKIQVSPDGANWYDYQKIIGSDFSATATSTVTINAATSTFVGNMDVLKDTFFAVRCIVTETTDGEHTCKASAEY